MFKSCHVLEQLKRPSETKHILKEWVSSAIEEKGLKLTWTAHVISYSSENGCYQYLVSLRSKQKYSRIKAPHN
jgi:hypothetical protein